MKLEWRELFDDNTGADGGGSIGEVGGDNGPPAPPANQTETGGDAPAADPTPIPSKPAADTGGDPSTGGGEEPGPVAFNPKLQQVFRPVQPQGAGAPPPGYGRPSEGGAPPGTPQGPPPRPTAEMWQMEPDKAAELQEKYNDWKIQTEVARARQPIEEMRSEQQREKARAFQAAAAKAEDAQEKHWNTVLNRDRSFRANPKLQELTSGYMGEYIAAALNNGSIEDLQFVSTPRFARRCLFLAKADLEDIEAYTARPTGGPQTVGQQNPKGPQGSQLDDETASALKDASEWSGKEITEEKILAARKRSEEFPW